jgi:ectoine hydroxylase-related dioxygenase (phytanoyl-CoA dioxygenase family)
LAPAARAALEESGFVVLPGPFPVEQLGAVADAYDAEVGAAVADDIRAGSTSTRVTDFVNRGPLFDPLYLYPPLLAAAALTIGRTFKLSSFHARTLRPGSTELDIHVDVERGSADWPLLSFIFMVDAFTPDNGATRFIAGSHRWDKSPRNARLQKFTAQLVSACGEAGSLLVFNGSTWHGQGVNSSMRPRRSLQGAFIPRGGRAATDFGARMQRETVERLTPLARQILGL